MLQETGNHSHNRKPQVLHTVPDAWVAARGLPDKKGELYNCREREPRKAWVEERVL